MPAIKSTRTAAKAAESLTAMVAIINADKATTAAHLESDKAVATAEAAARLKAEAAANADKLTADKANRESLVLATKAAAEAKAATGLATKEAAKADKAAKRAADKAAKAEAKAAADAAAVRLVTVAHVIENDKGTICVTDQPGARPSLPIMLPADVATTLRGMTALRLHINAARTKTAAEIIKPFLPNLTVHLTAEDSQLQSMGHTEADKRADLLARLESAGHLRAGLLIKAVALFLK